MRKSIVEGDPSVCYVCGCSRGLQRHHIFGGNRNRTWSERYGLTVHLCYQHHLDSREGVHFNAELTKTLHKEGQRAFEREYPDKVFADIFGINYLDETEKKRSNDIQIENGFTWIKE